MTSSAVSLLPCYVHLTRLSNIPVIPFKPYRRKSRVCPKCDEYFKNRKDFTKHLLHHLSRRSHKKKHLKLPQNRKKCCPICQEVFRKKWDLIQHLVIHLTDLEKQAEKKRQTALAVAVTPKTKLQDKKPLIQTKLKFKPSKLLRKTLPKSTPIQRQIVEPSRNFKASKPNSTQIQKQNLKTSKSKPPQRKIVPLAHSNMGRKASVKTLQAWKLTCYFCGMKWPHIRPLMEHMTKHTREQPNRCPHPGCHSSFTRAGTLNVHMRIHDPDGPPKYECHKCEKTYTHRSSLYVHFRHTHLKKFSFNCKKCKIGFTRQIHLDNHLKKKCHRN